MTSQSRRCSRRAFAVLLAAVLLLLLLPALNSCRQSAAQQARRMAASEPQDGLTPRQRAEAVMDTPDAEGLTPRQRAEAAREALDEARPQIVPDAPADQEISLNFDFFGKKTDGSLAFEFKVLWGDYGHTQSKLILASSSDRGQASLDLGVAAALVKPKVTGKARGAYDVTLQDKSGRKIGSFAISDSGAPVKMTECGADYVVRMAYYEEEKRLSGFKVHRKGQERETELGLIFVGKGWKTVEERQRPDLSKGYIFPEVDLVVLPRTWNENYRLADTCESLKRGIATGGGRCYS